MEAEIAACLRASRLSEVQFSEDRPVSGEDFPEAGKRRILEAMERGLELVGRYIKDAGGGDGSSIGQTVARSIYAPLILASSGYSGCVIHAAPIPCYLATFTQPLCNLYMPI